MDFVPILLGGAFVAAAAAAGWALADRRRLAREASAARGQAEAASREASRLEAALEGERRAHAEAVQGLERLAAEREAALERQRVIERESLEREWKARLEAAERVAADSDRRQKAAEEAFSAAAAKALQLSREDFLALARKAFEAERAAGVAEMDKRRAAVDELIRPMAETLRRTEEKLTGLSAASEDLKSETVRLVRALSRPEVRGRYGEVQLRRVAELAGMKPYCDFAEQESRRDGEGRLLRPDMIVRLPNDRVIAVDAKTNTSAYLEAANARDPREQEECLERFARHVCEQVAALSRKQYWAEYDGSPQFVVMFVPGDQFLDAALARRPDLLERAAEQNVVLASPSTLIGLLRAVAVGWREKRVEEEARVLLALGRELHERAAVAFEHVGRMGRSVQQVVERYNDVVGSLENRLMPTLRKFEESGAGSGREVPRPPEVTVATRTAGLLSGARAGGTGEP